MANQRSGVPAGWHWREGRPRWIPSPSLRKAGWKGLDLKDPAGRWLGKADSFTAAEALCAAVAGWRAGELVPHRFTACAPPGAALRPGAGLPVAATDRRSIGALLDAYLGAPEAGIPPSDEFKRIANKIDRRSKLGRLVDVLAGYVVKPRRWPDDDARAAYAAKVAAVRAFSIDVLEPPEFEDRPDLEAAQGPLHAAYWKLRDQVGENMAHGVLADVSAFLEWCVRRRAIRQNWAKLVDRDTPAGRIRVGTWDELAALIAAAEGAGWPSIADSIILGVDLSWSQVDRRKLTWAQISAENTVRGARQKTGRSGATPLLAALGVPRLTAIRARQAAAFGPNVTPTHVLICEATGRPWTRRYYCQVFAEIRSLAAAKVPSVATLWDLDLRDTAITVAKAAGLSNEQIATRTLHSLKRIADVLDKHYVDLGQDVADAGADKLNAYLGAKGVRL
jgi:hypothetical protein